MACIIVVGTKEIRIVWGCSSAGRALEWHSRGRRFDPVQLHHPKYDEAGLSGLFSFPQTTVNIAENR